MKGDDFITKRKTNTPTDDLAFHAIFGNSAHKGIVDNFIKTIFKAVHCKSPLGEIQIKSEFSIGKAEDFLKKSVRLDIIAEYDNHIVAIEMQKNNVDDIYTRTRYYFSKICSTQLDIGDKYSKMKPITMITILNYIPHNFKVTKKLENMIIVEENSRNVEVEFGIKFIYIYLPLLKGEQILSDDSELVQWLTFFKYPSKEVISMVSSKNTNVKEADDILQRISAEENERRIQRVVDNAKAEARFAGIEGYDRGQKAGEKVRHSKR